MKQGRGLILAAPSSGAGKTTVTLGLLRAMTRAGLPVRSAKSGPDYIDPRFHAAASGQSCITLDAWAMTPDRLVALSAGPGLLLIEGAMGLFDGAPPHGRGACADLARHLKLPVILIVDAGRMAQSVAPIVAGFAGFDPDVSIDGIILNRVGSPRHETMLRRALAPMGIPVLGALPRLTDLETPSRHLGLVQAGERPDLEAFLERAADCMETHCDLQSIAALATPLPHVEQSAPRLSPPAQTIAVAKDLAFDFAYPHMLSDWRAAGAEVQFFSPLADDPAPKAEFIFLPGGYPELHAGRIAAASQFLGSLRDAAKNQIPIYGECGGYMALGETLTDAKGINHQMAGLLPLRTSFAQRKLHLGYRHVSATTGPMAGKWAAHEFHYATTIIANGPPLFKAQDAEGAHLADMGLHQGSTCGSFAHMIDRVPSFPDLSDRLSPKP